MIRVVLVDDQPIVRAGVARILAPEDGFEVVAECDDGSQVRDAVISFAPDIVLMDIRMPYMDGIEATKQLRSIADPPPVLVLTTFDEDETLWNAIEAGVAGFILKDATALELIAAARAVAGGGAWFDRAVTPRILGAYRSSVAPAQRQLRRIGMLSERETEVLRHMARGTTNREIAASLYVSEATVKSHVGSIFTKLQVRDRAAAIVFAYDHGVVSIADPPVV